MTDPKAIAFVKTTIYGWIGNLMRDMDAQGLPLSLEDISVALDEVSFDINQPVPNDREYEDFLRDQDGRGQE